MKISVVHPSRNRVQQAYFTIKKWTQNADNHIEYILCLDKDDFEKYVPFYQEFYKRYDYNFWVPQPLAHKNAIEAINYGAFQISGDLIVIISDDFDCPEHWDTLLLKELEGKQDFIVKTQDGLQKTLITLPIMDRTYYNRFGYVYFPEYGHMFCDQEMTAVGHLLGKVLTLDMTFEHLHYSTGKSKKDEINVKNDSTWRQGELLFNERLKTNFGVENSVMKYEDIVWK